MVREDRLLAATYGNRTADTQAKIDEDPTLVKVFRGRTQTNVGTVRVRISTSNNIPNNYRTAASESTANDVTVLAMPGANLRAGDRLRDEIGQSYLIKFIFPGQEWGIEAQAVVEAQGAIAP